jgi:hypothetical protein
MIRAFAAALILNAGSAAAFDGCYRVNCTGPWADTPPS